MFDWQGHFSQGEIARGMFLYTHMFVVYIYLYANGSELVIPILGRVSTKNIIFFCRSFGTIILNQMQIRCASTSSDGPKNQTTKFSAG